MRLCGYIYKERNSIESIIGCIKTILFESLILVTKLVVWIYDRRIK